MGKQKMKINNITKIFFTFFLCAAFSLSLAMIKTENFSLLTSNALLHSFYIKYSNNWIIDIADRIASFDEEMSKAQAGNIDILCFQEWPYGNTSIDKDGPIKVVTHNAKLPAKNNYYNKELFTTKTVYNSQSQAQFEHEMNKVINHYFPAHDYYHLKPNSLRNDGLFMVVNKKKFNVMRTDVRTLVGQKDIAEGKLLFTAHLRFNNNPKKSIAVLTSHLPFNDQIAIENFTILKKAIDSFDADGKIICGDFNFNSWHEEQMLDVKPINNLKEIFNGYQLSACDLPCPTAKNGSNNAPLLLDYVIYSKGLDSIKKEILPEELKERNLDRLIAHNTDKKATSKMFYSDHAALLYDFDLTFNDANSSTQSNS